MILQDPSAEDAAPATAPGGPRRRGWAVLALAALLGAAAAAAAWWQDAHARQSTGDAYVAGNLVQLTPQVAGTVVDIEVDDTQRVEAGQVVVRLDRTDTALALDDAQAGLASAVRQVRQLYQAGAQARAQVALQAAERLRAEDDLARRVAAGPAAVGEEELQHARRAVDAAMAAAEVAQQELARAQSAVDGTTVETHPDVARARVRLKQAYVAAQRTAVRAPVSGEVARRSVQLGQQVQPGAALLAIVPTDQLWVEANFKEPQLADLRVGQPVTMTADLYGSRVRYRGTVVGFSAGTGAAFALLPAQNATGNWIKVVQRVPVRIAIDPDQLRAHPLRIGLSMNVVVDTRDRSGSPLGAVQTSAPAYSTTVFADVEAGAEALAQRVVRANLLSNHSALPRALAAHR